MYLLSLRPRIVMGRQGWYRGGSVRHNMTRTPGRACLDGDIAGGRAQYPGAMSHGQGSPGCSVRCACPRQDAARRPGDAKAAAEVGITEIGSGDNWKRYAIE